MPENTSSPSQKGRIFISYRRIDSAGYAGRIYDRLVANFGVEAIFMDVDTIEGGTDFVKVLEDAVQSCDVLIALIGRQWLSVTDKDGKRRLDNPEDFVRIEIAAALKRNIRVIPVLVDGVDMPQSIELPENLKALARRNALQVNHHSFNPDVYRLIEHSGAALEEAENMRVMMKAQALQVAREKVAIEKAERETAENAVREKAAREKAEKESDEKARLEAEEQARQKAAKEKAEREAVEKTVREKKEREQREATEKVKAEELYKKTNSALQFEWNQDFENALKIYYEIRNIDSTYPNVETKIKELEKEIQIRHEKSRREAEEQARQKSAKEKAEREAADKIAREKVKKEDAERARLVAEERARQRAAKEKAEREAAEKVAREKAEHEAAEKVRLEAEEKAKQKTANEKAKRDADEKATREKVKRESVEKIKRDNAKRGVAETKPVLKPEIQKPQGNSNAIFWVVGIIFAIVLVVGLSSLNGTPSSPAPTSTHMPLPQILDTTTSTKTLLPTATQTPFITTSSKPNILWTENCDPRTDPDYCNVSSSLNLFDEFYSVIDSLDGEISYSLPSSVSDLELYDLAIVDFCHFGASYELVTILKQYVESGGSVIVMGGNFCSYNDNYTSQWATELTKDFDITFTGDDDSENQWGEPVVSHPLSEGVSNIYSFRHAYLNVSDPSKTVFAVNGQPLIAIYDGVGKIVAIADETFNWGSDAHKGIDLSGNFILWKNIITWLAR